MKATRILLLVVLALALRLVGPTPAHAIKIAVYASEELSPIRVITTIDEAFGAGTATQVTSASLEIPSLGRGFSLGLR
jgi:hypothetical protein